MLNKRLLNEEDQIYLEREFHRYGQSVISMEISIPINKVRMTEIYKVDKKTSVDQVVKLFKDKSLNAVLVCDGDKQDFGIFTENDFLNRLVFEDLDSDNLKVEDFVTKNPKCLDIDNPIICALNAFAHAKFKHIPVSVNGDFRYMLTPNDILNFISSNFNKSVLNLPPDPLQKSREIHGR